MSKAFHVTVRGQYQSLHEGSGVPSLKLYEETFVLPSQEAALSNICRHLLAPRLRKKHSDYIRFRTHELVGITLVGYTPDREVLQMGIDDMSLTQLHDFCILRQIMIDPFKHATLDIFAIRAMVQKAYTEKRTAIKENEKSKEGLDIKEADALRKANNLEPVSKDPVINLNEQKLTHAAAKESTTVQASAGGVAMAPIEADEPLPAPEADGDQNGDIFA